MKFIRITKDTAVNSKAIDRITRANDGFAIVHVGMEQFRSQFTYDSLLNILAVDAPERGTGPNPTSTAATY